MITSAIFSILAARAVTAQVICCATSSKFVVPKAADLAELTSVKDDELTLLESGNYGARRNGYVVIITPDAPVFAGLTRKFNLAKRLVTLVSDGRSKWGDAFIGGSELSGEDCKELERKVKLGIGIHVGSEQIQAKKRMFFTFGQQLNLKAGKEWVSCSPSVQFASGEEYEDYSKNRLVPTTLTETDPTWRVAQGERNKLGAMAVSETEDAGYTLKVYNAVDSVNNHGSAAKAVAECVSELFDKMQSKYNAELDICAQSLQKHEKAIFEDYNSKSLTEEEISMASGAISRQYRERGLTQPEIESKIKNLSYSSRCLLITFQTGFRLYGEQKGSNFAAAVQVWP
jgi:hypothetical protein